MADDDPRPPGELDEEDAAEVRPTDEHDQSEPLARPELLPEEAGYRVTVPERGDDEED